MLGAFGVEKDARGNARATTDDEGGTATSVPTVFAAGDLRCGQSLVVWAIRVDGAATLRYHRFPRARRDTKRT